MAAIARELHMSPITVRKFAYAGAFPERSAHKRRQSDLLTPSLPYLHQRVAEGCENASVLWKEIVQLGFAQGYKVVNSWLRASLGKPGRPSTDEEKVKHQSFMEKVATEPGLVFASVQMMQEAKEPVPGEEAMDPLGSPRHLTWVLFRDPESLNAQEQSTLTFIREVHVLLSSHPYPGITPNVRVLTSGNESTVPCAFTLKV